MQSSFSKVCRVSNKHSVDCYKRGYILTAWTHLKESPLLFDLWLTA